MNRDTLAPNPVCFHHIIMKVDEAPWVETSFNKETGQSTGWQEVPDKMTPGEQLNYGLMTFLLVSSVCFWIWFINWCGRKLGWW